MGELKGLRIEKGLTQQEAADILGVSLRSYKSYENEEEKCNTMKYKYMVELLKKTNLIDEEHGVLTIESIRRKCGNVLERYDVRFCYLFGSYAKGKEKPASDVDLLISSEVKGLKFYGMVEELRTTLRKRVEVLDMSQLKENPELMEEILKDGVKIYG